jgi:glutathione S-transferase
VAVDGKPINESLVILEYLEDGESENLLAVIVLIGMSSAYPDKKALLPKDPILRAHVRLAIDHVSKTIVPGFFKLMQTQDKEGQDKARVGMSSSCEHPSRVIK